MLFWNKICGIILIIFFATVSCKAQMINSANNSTVKTSRYNLPTYFTTGKINTNDKDFLLSPITVIPQDYYTQHFGIMCKKELAIEKATKIPFRFRLGSLQQCNYLEGKK